MALVVLVFSFLFLSCKLRSQDFSGSFAAPKEVEAKVSDFASNCSLKDN